MPKFTVDARGVYRHFANTKSPQIVTESTEMSDIRPDHEIDAPATLLPLVGRVEPDGKVSAPPAFLSRSAPDAADDAARQGPGPVTPELSRAPDVITQILIDGFPNPDPRYRVAQCQWAREVLWGRHATPYRTLVACRVLIELSRDADERMVAAKIQKDAVAELRRAEHIDGGFRRLAWWAGASVVGLCWVAILALVVMVGRAQ